MSICGLTNRVKRFPLPPPPSSPTCPPPRGLLHPRQLGILPEADPLQRYGASVQHQYIIVDLEDVFRTVANRIPKDREEKSCQRLLILDKRYYQMQCDTHLHARNSDLTWSCTLEHRVHPKQTIR